MFQADSRGGEMPIQKDHGLEIHLYKNRALSCQLWWLKTGPEGHNITEGQSRAALEIEEDRVRSGSRNKHMTSFILIDILWLPVYLSGLFYGLYDWIELFNHVILWLYYVLSMLYY